MFTFLNAAHVTRCWFPLRCQPLWICIPLISVGLGRERGGCCAFQELRGNSRKQRNFYNNLKNGQLAGPSPLFSAGTPFNSRFSAFLTSGLDCSSSSSPGVEDEVLSVSCWTRFEGLWPWPGEEVVVLLVVVEEFPRWGPRRRCGITGTSAELRPRSCSPGRAETEAFWCGTARVSAELTLCVCCE